MNETAFFAGTVERERLVTEARAWLRTPFVAHGRVRGAGVDCVHLCAEIYLALGALTQFDPPEYTMDGGRHMERSMVLDWVERSRRFCRVPGPEIGALVCIKTNRVEHHCGIVLTPETFLHSLRGYGVIESPLGDPTWRRNMSAVYRPVVWPASGGDPV